MLLPHDGNNAEGYCRTCHSPLGIDGHCIFCANEMIEHVKKPNNAYGVRRYLTLVQVLAIEDDDKRDAELERLCKAWGVEPEKIWYDGWHLDFIETSSRLARHVVAYYTGQK